MRTQIRRDRTVPAHVQFMDMQADALRSQTHPNGIANTLRQRALSAAQREAIATAKAASRAARSKRRRAKKAAM